MSASAEPTVPLAGLHDIRLPADAAGGAISEIVAAIGIGLLIALCIAAVVRAVSRPATRPSAAPDLLAALATAPQPHRREAALALLAAHRPSALRALGDAVYRRDGVPSAELEALLREPPR